MKILAIALILTFALSAQEAAKVPAPKNEPTASAQTERPLTEAEIWHLKDTVSELSILDSTYKIEEYNAKKNALLADQMSVVRPACESVGVAAEKISAECGVTIPGKDKDGKAILGADGKPMTGKVWNSKPPEAPAKK